MRYRIVRILDLGEGDSVVKTQLSDGQAMLINITLLVVRLIAYATNGGWSCDVESSQEFKCQ